MRRLMTKTRYVRELQAFRGERRAADTEEGNSAVISPGVQPNLVEKASSQPAPMWGASLTARPAGTVNIAAQLDFHQGVFGMGDDILMDMLDFPTDLPMNEIFGSLEPNSSLDDQVSEGLGYGHARLDRRDWAS